MAASGRPQCLASSHVTLPLCTPLVQAGAQMAAENLNTLFKSHGAHPLKSFIPLLVNAPVFISFFIALRKMAELPGGCHACL